MPEDAVAEDPWKAPYLSYETYSGVFERKLGAGAVPPRIDSNFLDNYAGSVRPLIIAALKTTGMIGEQNEVLPPLREAVKDSESRKRLLRRWAQDFYSEQLALAERDGTASMLWETFAKHGYSGSTLRKAVVFYLALVEDLGLPNSLFFKAPKAQQPSNGRSARRGRAKINDSSAATPAQSLVDDPAPGVPAAGQNRVSGDTYTVDLDSGGQVSVVVDVNLFDLTTDDRNFVIDLVDRLKGYTRGDEQLMPEERAS